MKVLDFKRSVSKLMKTVAGVLDVRVSLDDKDIVDGIYLTALSRRDAANIKKDAVSLLAADLSLEVDPNAVFVMQSGFEGFCFREKRVELKKVETTWEPCGVSVSVVLDYDAYVSQGTAKGGGTSKSLLRASSLATIKALTKLLPERTFFSFLDCSVVAVKTVRVALVTLTLHKEGEEILLTGSCPVLLDEAESAVKATLHAVNRRLCRLLP